MTDLRNVAKQEFPERARAAFGLALAERALAKHHWDAGTAAMQQRGLVRSWSWAEREEPRHSFVYESFMELAKVDLSLPDGPRAEANAAATTAISYVCWLAFSGEVQLKKIELSQVPGEMFDGSDDLLDAVANNFVAAGATETEARELLDRLRSAPFAAAPGPGMRAALLGA